MNELHQKHMELFAKVFVEKNRRDRWVGILTKHKNKNFSLSSKLFDHLNRNLCSRNDELEGVTANSTKGVFYNFYDEPIEITFEEAKEIGNGIDAVFSIKAGSLAVYFFHEMENYVCKKT